MTTELPTDILFFNILPRLPAKSASRFRSVSKQWNSFLTTPVFIKMHLHHATNENRRKLLLSSATTPHAFHTIDLEALEDGLTASRSFPFVATTCQIITSCNGLICVGLTKKGNKDKYSDMMLWNPLTGEYKRLRYPYSHNDCYKISGTASQLFYVAFEYDYKLLRITTDRDAYIYSLNFNSWRKLHNSTDINLESAHRPYWGGRFHSFNWGASTILDGKLYFLHEHPKVIALTTLGQLSYSITRFDIKTEKFTMIAAPCFGDKKAYCYNPTLLNKDGKLHFFASHSYRVPDSTEKSLVAKLWRMDGDGEWTEVERYWVQKKFYYMKPLHFMKNGNWVTVCRSGIHVKEVDPARGFKKMSYVNAGQYIDFIEGKAIYIETLVSPNRQMS